MCWRNSEEACVTGAESRDEVSGGAFDLPFTSRMKSRVPLISSHPEYMNWCPI